MSDDNPSPPPDAPHLGLFMLAYNATVTGPGLRNEGDVELDSRLFAPREVDLRGDVLINYEALGVSPEPIRLQFHDEEDRARRERNGRELVEEARRACEAESPRALRILAALFPSIVLRLPEVHAKLEALPSNQAEVLVGTRRGPGRPLEAQVHLGRVRCLERLAASHQLSVTDAAERLTATGVHPSQQRLQNLTGPKAAYARYARFLAQGVLVPTDELEPLEWGAAPTTTVTVYVTEQE